MMKCLACSGVSPDGSRFCQFCGGKDFAGQLPAAPAAPVVVHSPLAVAAPEAVKAGQEKTENFFQSILKIKGFPSNGFRWLPFLFSVPYLAGYGNTKEANRTIWILVGGYIVAWMFVLIGQGALAGLSVLATFIFQIYYCYLVATHVDALAKRSKAFNWSVAIGYTLLYVFVSAILTNRL